ncbi:MAG TPA: DUF2232 domain-containing protein [bacterium]|nr:DUF2232 domain-containing protein [bacterium]HOL48148.1 DUF2232 domain-containing protein [bacterium]HPQ18496.1 DUF2232 domain-containing protein [bacterium]
MKTHKYSTYEIVEAGLFASISAVIYFLFGIFSSIPITILILKYSLKTGILASIVATIIVYFFSGILYTFMFVTIFVFTGILMAYFIKYKQIKPYINIIFTSAIVFFIFIFFLLIFMKLQRIDITSFISQKIEIAKKTALSFSNKFNFSSVKEREAIINMQISFLKKSLPSLFYSSIFINTLLSYFVLQYVCKSFKINLPYLEKFLQFNLDDYFIWFLLIAFAGVLFLKQYKFLYLLCMNLGIILFIFYFIQGLAVIKFWFLKYDIKPIFQLFFFILIFLLGLIIFIGVLGIFDVWFDFRNLHKKEEEEGKKIL